MTLSASRRERVKDNAYLNISEAPAWAMLERLRAMDPALATGILRHACGFEAAPGAQAAIGWIGTHRNALRSVLDKAPASFAKAVVPFGDPAHPIAKASAARQPEEAERLWRAIADQTGVELGIGPWGERPVYSSEPPVGVCPEQQERDALGCLFATAGSTCDALDATWWTCSNRKAARLRACVLCGTRPTISYSTVVGPTVRPRKRRKVARGCRRATDRPVRRHA